MAFFAVGSSGQSGIYTNIGGLNRVADENTAIPDGTGNFRIPGVQASEHVMHLIPWSDPYGVLRTR